MRHAESRRDPVGRRDGCLRQAHRKVRRGPVRCGGLTLVELVLIATIVAVLATLAVSLYQRYRVRINLAQAVTDISILSVSITKFKVDNKRLPTDLAEIGKNTMRDPWGNPYQYVNHATAPKRQWRKDENANPINTDFDLCSVGKDGASVSALTAQASRDDVVRATDGAFIGPVTIYDP